MAAAAAAEEALFGVGSEDGGCGVWMEVRGGGCVAPRTMLKGETLPKALPLVEGPSAVSSSRKRMVGIGVSNDATLGGM